MSVDATLPWYSSPEPDLESVQDMFIDCVELQCIYINWGFAFLHFFLDCQLSQSGFYTQCVGADAKMGSESEREKERKIERQREREGEREH